MSEEDRRSRRRVLLGAASAIGVATAGCVTAPIPDVVGVDQLPQGTQSSEGADPDAGPYAEVYDATIDSVVLIETAGSLGGGQGSGFVYDGRHIVTNDHVVADAARIDVRFAGNEHAEATVEGTDVFSDLAVLSVDSLPGYADPLPLAPENPSVGQEVVVLGNPLGFDASVTQGIVSGVNRSLDSPTGFAIPNAVQTDAAVSPGNSGGPLVDMAGRVVAVINSGADNIGFGISTELTQRVVPALIEHGRFQHTFLGVRLADVSPAVATANDLEGPIGVIVVEVLEDGPARNTLRGSEEERTELGEPIAVGGDVIVGLDGEEISTRPELSSYLALEVDPGDELELEIVRDGEFETVTMTVGTRPEP